jgi:acetate---CoA ligase (ADP-forming)
VDVDNLHMLLNPRSVAVVGASADVSKVGGRTLRNLRTYSPACDIYAVNPKATEIQGVPCFPSIADIPTPPDVALICLPANLAVEALAAAARVGVRAAMIFAGGFAEYDQAGAELQRRIADISAASGIAVLGPNTMGVVSQDRFAGTQAVALEEIRPRRGRVAFAGQSGAVGSYILTYADLNGLDLGSLISTGNEAVVDVADCINLFAEDETIEILMVYLEGARDARKLARSLSNAVRRGKIVIACKVGTSDASARAASSHTASMVGADEVYDAIFERSGVIRCADIEEMVDVGRLHSRFRWFGKRVGIMTFSGGFGVLATDLCVAAGLEVPSFTAETSALLKEAVPFAAVGNPIDTTAQGINDLSIFERMLATAAADPMIDSFLVNPGASLLGETRGQLIAEAIARVGAASDRPMVVTGMATRETAALLARAGLPLYPDIRTAIRAMSKVAGHTFPTVDGDVIEEDPAPLNLSAVASALLSRAHAEGGLGEAASKQLLRECRVTTVPGLEVHSRQEAGRAAAELGLPVAVKASGREIMHKSEIGAIRLGLSTLADVGHAYDTVSDSVCKAYPRPVLESVLVERMDTESTLAELMISVSLAPGFGEYLVIGMGGIYTNILDDKVVLLPPFKRCDIREGLRSLRGFGLIDGYRGSPKADIENLIDLISQVGRLGTHMARLELELELNPVAVHAPPGGTVVLDAIVMHNTGYEARAYDPASVTPATVKEAHEPD